VTFLLINVHFTCSVSIAIQHPMHKSGKTASKVLPLAIFPSSFYSSTISHYPSPTLRFSLHRETPSCYLSRSPGAFQSHSALSVSFQTSKLTAYLLTLFPISHLPHIFSLYSVIYLLPSSIYISIYKLPFASVIASICIRLCSLPAFLIQQEHP